ncbi:MAG: phosphoglucosamine mutase [Cyclobacteriaceae bacterium]|nr:phosphoglucosamine mutase [Cyclobacteriaceae bacterium]
MALMKSISGIRGTIGGAPGDNLTPVDIVRYTAAFGTWILTRKGKTVVIGRDARISGELVSNLVSNTLRALGLHVVDLGLSTTPTVEMAVPLEKAAGGIIITASHNPMEWNALKLLNEKGEFISAGDGAQVLRLAEEESFTFAPVERLGKYTYKSGYLEKHINLIIKNKWVDVKAIRKARFKVAVDAVNSTGGLAVPLLLKSLGVRDIVVLNGEPNGKFAHNPEPLPENIRQICRTVKQEHCDLGIVVDPDVDRLALIMENGKPFGEEYTLVAVADYILKKKKGNTVSNLSSTRALRDITERAGGNYFASAVGEVNVVEMMKKTKAIIGGEGNGGVIFPELHYGRDALMGIALFLSHLAKSGMKASELRRAYPDYFMAKKKIELRPGLNADAVLQAVQQKYAHEKINTADGVKIDFERTREWVHLRKSNTEPIIRIYSESSTQAAADALAEKIMNDIHELI